jgi:hypothetical protein
MAELFLSKSINQIMFLKYCDEQHFLIPYLSYTDYKKNEEVTRKRTYVNEPFKKLLDRIPSAAPATSTGPKPGPAPADPTGPAGPTATATAPTATAAAPTATDDENAELKKLIKQHLPSIIEKIEKKTKPKDRGYGNVDTLDDYITKNKLSTNAFATQLMTIQDDDNAVEEIIAAVNKIKGTTYSKDDYAEKARAVSPVRLHSRNDMSSPTNNDQNPNSFFPPIKTDTINKDKKFS